MGEPWEMAGGSAVSPEPHSLEEGPRVFLGILALILDTKLTCLCTLTTLPSPLIRTAMRLHRNVMQFQLFQNSTTNDTRL